MLVLTSTRSKLALTLAVLMVAAGTACGQQVLLQRAGFGRVGTSPGGTAGVDTEGDPGTPVEMFENPNLDRYLRRAQSFMERDDYSAAIQVLQEVVEGRTSEVLVTPGETETPTAPTVDGGAVAPGAPPESPPEGPKLTAYSLDAAAAVFSSDGRIYRPVRRLCHEMLAGMPAVGIEIYRTHHEFAAEELLQRAETSGDVQQLEEVANRFFVTLPAGKAMALLVDRLMQLGRYRAAGQVLRDLIEVYPEANRRLLRIDDVWLRFKLALCLRMAGEREGAHTAIRQLAEAHPDASLRILGELETVRTMPDSELFARDTQSIAAAPIDSGDSWLRGGSPRLVPMWQFRFLEPQPYREPKPERDRNVFFVDGGMRTNAMPFSSYYGPGTWVHLTGSGGASEPRALFFEHYRLRSADAATGLLLRETEGAVRPGAARENMPRVRIAAVDFALLRPVEDGARIYTVIGYESPPTASPEVLKRSRLIAIGSDDWQQVWSSDDWQAGDDGLRNVTFLAAPTVSGERLLLPAKRDDHYSLECIERTTGKPLWHVPLHAGGSSFYKSPGCPVVVDGGIAYAQTNAGCVAAVDTFAGKLRWIRRYERVDPLRPPKVSRSAPNDEWMAYQQFPQDELSGFWPNEMILDKGLLVFAPSDGNALLAVDTASGAVVWLVDGNTRYAPYGRLRTIVGHTAERLFALSESHLVAIDLAGGLVRWAKELPADARLGEKADTRGRGLVVGEWVVLPAGRDLVLCRADGSSALQRIDLPSMDDSRDPMGGSCELHSHGPWLAIGYAGGVEVYSDVDALRRLAATTPDPLRSAFYLRQSGDEEGAARKLEAAIGTIDLPSSVRHAASQRLLSLTRQRGLERSGKGELNQALAALDAVRPLLVDQELLLDWHLARVECCTTSGDLLAREREQQLLYDCMEGRR